MMWWAICCAAVVAGSASAAAAPAPDSLAPIDFVQMDSAPDDESLGYGAPAMGGRYAAGSPWLYLLAEMPRDSQVGSEPMRARRSVSVFPAVEQLQRDAFNRYLERVVLENRNYLKQIGKRGPRSHGY